jgi:AcrR family transcriptional regulator
MENNFSNGIEKSTEERIIEAARRVFLQKGFAATRTRDISEEAGINLALLNYYFKSKENLFSIVMAEKVDQFFSVILSIVNDNCLTLDEKVEKAVNNYIALLVENPDISLFVLNEIKSDPENFKNSHMVMKILGESSMIMQIKERKPDADPLQYMITLLGMTVFPAVAKKVIFKDRKQYEKFMLDRKPLILKWMKAILD